MVWKVANITNRLFFFSELAVKYLWARVCVHTCVRVSVRETHVCRVANCHKEEAQQRAGNALGAARRAAPARTHQSQVLHRLRKHALMQLQLANLHHLHTSDGVAAWEEDPGRNPTTQCQ